MHALHTCAQHTSNMKMKVHVHTCMLMWGANMSLVLYIVHYCYDCYNYTGTPALEELAVEATEVHVISTMYIVCIYMYSWSEMMQ